MGLPIGTPCHKPRVSPLIRAFQCGMVFQSFMDLRGDGVVQLSGSCAGSAGSILCSVQALSRRGGLISIFCRVAGELATLADAVPPHGDHRHGGEACACPVSAKYGDYRVGSVGHFSETGDQPDHVQPALKPVQEPATPTIASGAGRRHHDAFAGGVCAPAHGQQLLRSGAVVADTCGLTVGRAAIDPSLDGGPRQNTIPVRRFGLDSTSRGNRYIGGEQPRLCLPGAGLASLRRHQKVLAERCGSLYLPRGSNPVINQLLNSVRETEEKQRQAMLHVETWQEQVEAHRQATKRKTELEQRRRDVRAEIDRLRSCVGALPIIRQWNEVRGEVERLPQRDAILDEERVISELREALGACLKAHRDQADLIQQSKEKKDRAMVLLKAHFQRDDLEQVAGLCPSAATKRRIQELSQERKASLEAHETAQTTLRAYTGQIKDLQRRLAEFPDLPDVSQLEALHNGVLQEGPIEQQAREAEVALAERQHKAQVLLGRLQVCWSGSLEEAVALRVRPEEWVAGYGQKFEQMEKTHHELERRIEQLQKTMRDAERAIQRLERSGLIPTEEALTEARTDRDNGLELVRTAWLECDRLDENRANAFIARHAPGGHLLDALKKSIQHCDELADRLRREAQRVADRDAQEQRRAEAAAELETEQQKLASWQEKTKSLREAWDSEWQACHIAAREPAEMIGWLRTHAQLVEIAAEIRGLEVKVDQLHGQIASARSGLQTALGMEAADPDQPLNELLELARQRIAEVQKQAEDRRNLENQLAEARRRSQEAEDAADQAENRLRQWAADWREAIGGLGLDQDALPEAVQVRLEQLDEILSELREAAGLEQRIADINRDLESFLRRLNGLRARLTPGCPDSTVESMQADVDALEARLNEARQTETRRQAHQREADRLRRDLLERAGNRPLDEFCSEVLAQADTFQQRLEELQKQEQALDAEIADLSEKAGRAKSQLEAWEKAGSEAAQLRQERVSLLARLREHVVEYATYCWAQQILDQAVESFRQRHQGTMLGRAGEYFSLLTCHAFKRLEVEEDGAGNLVLKAVRPHPHDAQREEWVSMDGLSDGTRDQLFLALRLAGIEEHLGRREPMPVIVDDILVNFDNHRAAATLRCLAELSGKTQVLLFTHHEHLVELARQNVATGVLFCHTF